MKKYERIPDIKAGKCLLQEQVISLNHACLQMQHSKKGGFVYEQMESLLSQIKQVMMYLNMQKKCWTRVNKISPILLSIELIGLVLNLLLITVRLFLSDLQCSVIEQWKKIKNNVKAIANLFSNGRKGILILHENNHCITQYKNICFFLNIFCFL